MKRIVLILAALAALSACGFGQGYHPYSEDTHPLNTTTSN